MHRLVPMLLMLAVVAPASAATIDLVGGVSGRIGADSLAGVNYAFGTTDASTAAGGNLFSGNDALLGDNPANVKFAQMWRFDATPEFAADVAAGQSVQLRFRSGAINRGGGAPADINVFLLSVGNNDRVQAATATPIGSFATISGTAANTDYDLAVTNMPAVAAGDRIWVGLISGLSQNSQANNIFIGGSSNSLSAQLVTIPEPTTLAASGMAALVLVRRRR